MKNAMMEYIILDNQQRKDLWANAVFVFDTNVLLALYRYSEEEKNVALRCIKELHGKIWMPYQVLQEFSKNRLQKILASLNNNKQIESSKEKFIKSCIDCFGLGDGNPDLVKLSNYLNDWIEKQKERNDRSKELKGDPIQEALLELFDGKVGDRFSDTELENLKKDGEERYKNNIPPGYADSGKKSNMYGDLIIWEEMITYAKTNETNIVFVTNEMKNDWWKFHDNEIFVPQPELRREFLDRTQREVDLCTMADFIETINKEKHLNVKNKVIEGIRFRLNHRVSSNDTIAPIEEPHTDRAVMSETITIERLYDALKKNENVKDLYMSTLLDKYISTEEKELLLQTAPWVLERSL